MSAFGNCAWLTSSSHHHNINRISQNDRNCVFHLVQLFNRVWPISDMDTQQRKEFYKVRLGSCSSGAGLTCRIQ